jgi:hypothetical protein
VCLDLACSRSVRSRSSRSSCSILSLSSLSIYDLRILFLAGGVGALQLCHASSLYICPRNLRREEEERSTQLMLLMLRGSGSGSGSSMPSPWAPYIGPGAPLGSHCVRLIPLLPFISEVYMSLIGAKDMECQNQGR